MFSKYRLLNYTIINFHIIFKYINNLMYVQHFIIKFCKFLNLFFRIIIGRYLTNLLYLSLLIDAMYYIF